MKNIEKYEREISKLVNEDNVLPCAIATVAGIRKEKPCYHQECEECHKKCLEWMYSEYKEEILSDDEKDIVKAMCDAIYRFGCDEIISVCKIGFGMRSNFISISYKNEYSGVNETMASPIFRNDLFAGMELRKRYSLEELGITCQTQKDSFGRR